MQQRTSKWVRLGQVIRCRRFACIEARLYLARILHFWDSILVVCVCFLHIVAVATFLTINSARSWSRQSSLSHAHGFGTFLRTLAHLPLGLAP